MNYTWDIKILYPLIFIFLIFGFGFNLFKIKRLKTDGMFFVQQFCFWSSVFITVNINENYSLSYLLNHNESVWLIIFFSAFFYAIFLFIPSAIFTSKFRKRKLWFFLVFVMGMPGIVSFIAWPSLITALILAISMSFSAASTSQYYLFYSENFQNRIFHFTTISLVFISMTISDLFSINIENIINFISKNESVRTNTISEEKIYDSITALFIFVSFFLSSILILLIPEKKEMFGYCNIQFEKFEPFIWTKGIILFIFLIVIVVLEQVGHGLLFNWMLEQNVWTKYHSDKIVSLYSRLSEEFYNSAQILFGIVIGTLFISRIGIKYTFGTGLFLIFFYFSCMSFIYNPVMLLILDFISGIGYILILIPLLSLALMWQTRTPRKRILSIFSTIFMFTSLFSKYITQLLSNTNIGIFSLKTASDNYVQNDEITSSLNSETTIIFTIFAVVSLGLLILFYYCAEFILAEYNNDIYFLNKMSEITNKNIR